MGEARFTSSARTTLAKIPPARNSNSLEPRFHTETPVTSECSRSGVNWIRCQVPSMERAMPEQALKHPTWSMGKKVSIDSATLMNKALEIIEAHWLFGLPGEKIATVVHPQSMVHALVEFCDGSVMAQLASPDMKLPIQSALTWCADGPRRAGGCARRMKWEELRKLDAPEGSDQ